MATYTGTSLSDAGTIVSYVNPTGVESSTVADSRLRSLYTAQVTPVKQKAASIARLLPQSNGNTSNSNPTGSWDYRHFYTANVDRAGTNTYAPFAEHGVYLTGGSSGTGSLDVTLVYNYEFIPRFNTSSIIQADPSPIDPFEEAFVLGCLTNEDATGTCSIKQYASPPSSSGVTRAEKIEETGPLSPMTGATGFLGTILEVGLPLLAAVL